MNLCYYQGQICLYTSIIIWQGREGARKDPYDNRIMYSIYSMTWRKCFGIRSQLAAGHIIFDLWSSYFFCNVGEIIIIIVIIFLTSSFILVTSSHYDLIFDFWSSHLAWRWRETHWHINFIYPNLNKARNFKQSGLKVIDNSKPLSETVKSPLLLKSAITF